MNDDSGDAEHGSESENGSGRDLHHTEPLYRALVESSQDSIKILDLDGRLLSMNPGGRHLMEIEDLRKWIGRPWIDFWAEELRGSIRNALSEARHGKTGRFEGYRPTTKGNPKWWDVMVTPILDDRGQPQQILAVARDITDRKRAEDAVRFVAEASLVVTESLDYEQTLSNVANILVPGLADWCSIDMLGEDGTIIPAALQHSDPEKIEAVQEIRVRYPPFPDAPYGSPAVFRTGEAHLATHVTDEMLRAASRDEEQFRLAKSLHIRSYVSAPLKARGHTLGVMTVIGAESGRIYTEEDLPLLLELGRICGLAIENARLYKAANAEVSERRNVERKLRELNDTLEARVVERTGALENANTILKSEIAERERAETDLEGANRQLTSRNRELQEFAYAASHDLQEPLRKISSFVDLMREDFGDELPQLAREYLDRIQHASLRMSQLIRDLLTYSRVETRKRPTQRVDLNKIVDDVLIDLEVSVAESDAQIDTGALPVIDADPSQMRQLFQNLISNALKFRKDNEKPCIRISASLDPTEADDGVWHISVQDNGIGFDVQYLDRIFSPFQRLHERGKYPGTGMGLAICRRIVERHDGTIHGTSRLGEGTTFTITLPAIQNGSLTES